MFIRLWKCIASYRMMSVVSAIALWWIISLVSPKGFIPSPPTVFGVVFKIIGTGSFFLHMFDTLRRVIIGFGLAFGGSLTLGMLMGFVSCVEGFLEVWILIGLTIPSLAWEVIALLWFGTTDLSAIFSIFVILCPLMTLNMLEGTKALDRDLIEMAKVFHFSRTMIIRDIVVPQLVPYILAATRFGFALGWKVVVIAEMLGLNSGVGYMISYSFGLFDMVGVMAWTIAFTGVMFLIEFGVFRIIEKKMTVWRRPVIG